MDKEKRRNAARLVDKNIKAILPCNAARQAPRLTPVRIPTRRKRS